MLDYDVSYNGGDEGYIPGSNHHMLPCREFHGLWESLVYEKGVKDDVSLNCSFYKFLTKTNCFCSS